MRIAVVGAREPAPPALALAEAVGREIGRGGHTLVCGGLGGVMEAACRGARAERGHTIGILPGDEAAAANPYVEFAIPTGLGVARNALVARAGDAMIAIDGSYGTLSEIAFALQFGRPVVGLGTWTVDDGSGADPLIRVDAPAAAVAAAVAAAASNGSPRSR
ncbi:MAG: TIGR00725 family protein [Chloroflexi bacterium]|nr:TIGR00725 family protein [Chloroflexota bacterium]